LQNSASGIKVFRVLGIFRFRDKLRLVLEKRIPVDTLEPSVASDFFSSGGVLFILISPESFFGVHTK
jgi:hypothetical protein